MRHDFELVGLVAEHWLLYDPYFMLCPRSVMCVDVDATGMPICCKPSLVAAVISVFLRAIQLEFWPIRRSVQTAACARISKSLFVWADWLR